MRNTAVAETNALRQASESYRLRGMDDHSRPRGAVALDTWCLEDRGRAARVALVLSVQESTVSRWRSGAAVPGGPARLALPLVTGGAVPLDGWDDAAESPQ